MGGQPWNGIEDSQFGIRTGVQGLKVEEERQEGGRLCMGERRGGKEEGGRGLRCNTTKINGVHKSA